MMLPNAPISAPIQYGIVKERNVMEFINRVSHPFRDEIINAIDGLQFAPRPPGHQLTNFGPIPAINFVVGNSTPQHTVVCTVDDVKEKVYVMAIYEIRFSDRGQRAPNKETGNDLLDFIDDFDKFFDEAGLKELCLVLKVEKYENLAGDGKRAKAVDLIDICMRQGYAEELINNCNRKYPQVDWSKYLMILTDSSQ